MMTDTADVVAALEEARLTSVPDNLSEILARVTPAEVRKALTSPMAPFSPERLNIFVSPAATSLLEEMAIAAQAVTRQRFGHTMNLYAPLYLSNYCVNQCRYCGFNASHRGERTRLSIDDAVREAEVIAEEGFRDLLLVSGEDPEHVSIEYLSELAGRLSRLFSSISLEIYTLSEREYRHLVDAGIDGVTLYQETYDRRLYEKMHPGGPKADYVNRLRAQEAAAAAGMRRLGLGALLGMQDWRFETMALAIHANSLIRNYWRSKVSISFPRMRPASQVAVEFENLLSDTDLLQMMLALRLCFPDIGLVLSTRETATLRDRLLPLCITQMSAGSKTNPGGYAETYASTGQFEVADNRPVAEVVKILKKQGFDPVWKDWDKGFN